MMKAAMSRSYGPPESITIEDVPAPRPGRDELLVRIHATTVNRTDCAVRRASPPIVRLLTGLRRPKQSILGTEFAGVVEEVGPDVTAFEVGDRVFGYREPQFGCHAEYVAVGQDEYVARIPDSVSFAQAAAATEGAHYALSAIRAAGVTDGQAVLAYGATGAIGSAGVQLVPKFDASVTAVCGTAHVERVRALGPARVIDYETEDFTQCGERFEFVLDGVGKSSFGACKPLLKPGGIYCSTELGPGMQNIPLSLLGLAHRGRRVKFPFPHLRKDDLELIRQALDDGTFVPLIDSTRPLTEIAEASRYAESGQKIGSIVLYPDPSLIE
jgi:NADPH:quinone reductase-like Zn-dependent oxidoreductase